MGFFLLGLNFNMLNNVFPFALNVYVLFNDFSASEKHTPLNERTNKMSHAVLNFNISQPKILLPQSHENILCLFLLTFPKYIKKFNS